MNKYIGIYKNSPTAGGTDGTRVSEDGAQTAPIAAFFEPDQAMQQAIKCAVRCNTGYKAREVSLALENDAGAEKLKIAKDDNFNDDMAALAGAVWEDTLTYDEIGAENVIFWVKMITTADEEAQNDTATKIKVQAKVRAEV